MSSYFLLVCGLVKAMSVGVVSIFWVCDWNSFLFLGNEVVGTELYASVQSVMGVKQESIGVRGATVA